MKSYGNKFGLITADGVAGTVGTAAVLNVSGKVVTTTFDYYGDSSREITEVAETLYSFVSNFVPTEAEDEFLYEDATSAPGSNPFFVAIHMDGVEGVNRRVFAQYVKVNSAGAVTSAANEIVTTTIETTAIKTTQPLVISASMVSAITGKSASITIVAGQKTGYTLVSA